MFLKLTIQTTVENSADDPENQYITQFRLNKSTTITPVCLMIDESKSVRYKSEDQKLTTAAVPLRQRPKSSSASTSFVSHNIKIFCSAELYSSSYSKMDRNLLANATSADDSPTPGYMLNEIARKMNQALEYCPFISLSMFFRINHRKLPNKYSDTRIFAFQIVQKQS